MVSYYALCYSNLGMLLKGPLGNTSLLKNCTYDATLEIVAKLAPREFRQNETYIKVYIYWMNLFINLLAPLGIMFVLNVAVYREIKKIWAAPLRYCTHERCYELNQKRRVSHQDKSPPSHKVRYNISTKICIHIILMPPILLLIC